MASKKSKISNREMNAEGGAVQEADQQTANGPSIPLTRPEKTLAPDGKRALRTKGKPGTVTAKSAGTKEKVRNGCSALEAALRILAETREALTCKALVEQMAAKGYWSSPAGRTPAATLYAAILRELQAKGKNARFQKVERGKFCLNPNVC